MSFKLANYRTVTLAAPTTQLFSVVALPSPGKTEIVLPNFSPWKKLFKSKRDVKYKSQQALKFEALGVAEMPGFDVEMAAQLFAIRGFCWGTRMDVVCGELWATPVKRRWWEWQGAPVVWCFFTKHSPKHKMGCPPSNFGGSLNAPSNQLARNSCFLTTGF